MKRTYFPALLCTAILLSFASCKPLPPKLISPTNDSTSTDTTPKFTWTSSKYATTYGLEISTDSGIVFRQDGIKDTFYTVPSNQLSTSTVYSWRVNASNFFGTSEWSGKMTFMIQLASTNPFDFLCENDSDCDGIPDDEEINRFHTDPKKKTLFVQPKKESIYETKYVYWEEFIKLFPDSRPGFANLPPFTDAEIEIVVVGNEDPHFPYEPMRHFAYDPANDPNKPHCNILEVVLRMEKDLQGIGITIVWGYGTINEGHTFFDPSFKIWSWDTKGYTPGNVVHHGYFIPEIYPFPLNNYIKEGAYRNNIAQGEMPKTLKCNEPDCGPNQVNRRSPMNLSGNSPNYGLPDNTVEFNEILFDPNGRITFVGVKGNEYSRDEVLKRTIVHEMGHAITGFDHCENPQCIMYKATENWKMLNFGHSNACSHKERMKAGVHNEIHP